MKTPRRGALAACALIALLSASLPAGAATTTTVRRTTVTTAKSPTSTAAKTAQIQRLREQLAEVSAAEAALLDTLDDVVAKRRSLDQRLATLDRELAAAEGGYRAAEAGLEAISSDVVRAQAKLDVAESGLAAARRDLKAKAIEAYIRQPQVEAAEILLRVNSMRQLGAGSSFLSTIVAGQHDVVEQYKEFRSDAVGLRMQFEAQRDVARDQRDVAARHEATVQAARDAQARARAAVAAEAARQESIVAEARRRKSEFQAQINALRRESDSIGGLLRGVQRGQVFTGSGKGMFGLPLPGARLTSTYGYRTHPIYGDKRLHNGLDFSGSSGTPILSAGDGTVVYAGPRGGYGNVVIIDHGKAIATMYAHQSSTAVGSGAKVKRGQMVGRVGSTGLSTGPHLHFEVRVNGAPVDPMAYL